MQRSRCSEGGYQEEPDDLGTEAGIGNIVAETTLLHDCSTDDSDATDAGQNQQPETRNQELRTNNRPQITPIPQIPFGLDH